MPEDLFGMVWSGLSGFTEAIDRMATKADRAALANVTQAAALVEKYAKANFEGAHKRGEPHIGGEKPNVVTGTLRRSTHSDAPARLGYAEYRTQVYPRSDYGRRVELGYSGGGAGRGHHTTRAYPYFIPAVDKARPELVALVRTNWSRIFE